MPPGSAINFEARRHIDPVAKNIAPVHDHVAEIDADAVEQRARRGHVAVAPRHALLEIDGAAQRLGDALELDQHAVAHRLDDAALAFRDRGVDQLELNRLEARERSRLVHFHQTAVADHVRRDDCGEPAIGLMRFHSCSDPVTRNDPGSDPSGRRSIRSGLLRRPHEFSATPSRAYHNGWRLHDPPPLATPREHSGLRAVEAGRPTC